MAQVGETMTKHRVAGMCAAVALLATISSGKTAAKSSADPICAPLKAFITSIGPDETRTLEFHTSWGSGFKGSAANVFAERNCMHFGYAPAEPICKVLMEHSSIEFPGLNALRALACLSTDAKAGELGQLHRIEIEFRYGSDNRGSNVTIKLDEDKNVGGMVMFVTGEGY